MDADSNQTAASSQNRPSRLPAYTMASGNDSTMAQSHGGTPRTSSAWPRGNNIWASTPFGSNGLIRREAGAAAAGSDEALRNGLSGSSAIGASDADDNWPRSGVWNSSDPQQSRNTSGNTSPTRTRDAQSSIHDISTPSYFTNPRATVGQGASSSVRSTPVAAQLNPTARLGHISYRDSVTGDSTGVGAFSPANFISDQTSLGFLQNALNDPQFANSFGPLSRDRLPPSRHSESESQTPFYGDGSVFANAASHMRSSSRPSLSGPSTSFPQAANLNAYPRSLDNGENLADDYSRQFTLDDAAPPARPNGIHHASLNSFQQLNPRSQSWQMGVNNGSRPLNGMQSDAYQETAPMYLPSRLGGPNGQDSPAHSTQQRQVLNSPGILAGTPAGDTWSRPGSRDPSLGSDLHRRRQTRMFQQVQPFYTPLFNAYTSPNSLGFLEGQFDGSAYARSAMPLQPHNGHINPYLAADPAALGAGTVGPSGGRDMGHSGMSAAMEEFKRNYNSKNKKPFELKQAYGHIVEFSGDQNASREIQQKLETANSDEKEQVFREIEPNALQLMKDLFGNYVVQKFFEHGNQKQKMFLADRMKGRMVQLSTEMYACRVVQKALEHVLVDQQAELVKELEPEVIRVVKDVNGNHVIQKIVECVPREYIGFIMNAFRGHVSDLASHVYGCRVIQRLLEHGSDRDKAEIMREIHSCAHMLIFDQYGNYVIQHVVAKGKLEDRARIVAIVTGELFTFSKHKFASNVVEKCIQHCTEEELQKMCRQISAPTSDDASILFMMMRDQYANYVIQTLANRLQGEEREAFIEEMRQHVPLLKKTGSGRQILAIDKLISNVPSETASRPGSSNRVNGVPNGVPNGVNGTTPASLRFQPEATSALPTPGLTTEANSPRTSTSPSTNNSAVGESNVEDSKGVAAEAA